MFLLKTVGIVWYWPWSFRRVSSSSLERGSCYCMTCEAYPTFCILFYRYFVWLRFEVSYRSWLLLHSGGRFITVIGAVASLKRESTCMNWNQHLSLMLNSLHVVIRHDKRSVFKSVKNGKMLEALFCEMPNADQCCCQNVIIFYKSKVELLALLRAISSPSNVWIRWPSQCYALWPNGCTDEAPLHSLL